MFLMNYYISIAKYIEKSIKEDFVINNRQIKIAKYGYIVLSILIAILGLVLIIFPSFSASLLCKIGGIILILFGIVKIIGYSSKDLYRLAFQFDLAFGIFMIALGAILILRTEKMMSIISIIFGIFVLADALIKIQMSIDSKFFGIKVWWILLTIAIVTGIVGFLLILRPYESVRGIMIITGISLCFESLLNIFTALTVVKYIDKKKIMRDEVASEQY